MSQGNPVKHHRTGQAAASLDDHMPDYRCYCLSGDNRIVAVAEGTHPTDIAAIRWAEDLYAWGAHKECLGMELWRNARLVHRRMGRD